MKLSIFISVLLTSIFASGCASTGPSASELHLKQEQTIAKWHQCLDTNLTSLYNEKASPESLVSTTLVICQGHREDVLATFPVHLNESLDKLMKNQAYEAGFEQIAAQRGIFGTKASSVLNSMAMQQQLE